MPSPLTPTYFQTALPMSPANTANDQAVTSSSTRTTSTPPPSLSPPKPPYTAKLRLKIDDLRDPGSALFLQHINPTTDLQDAIDLVLTHLYQPHSPSELQANNHNNNPYHIPPTRSLTLHLHSFPGIAYTTGYPLDPTQHKQLHLSTTYPPTIHPPPSRLRPELLGVLLHETVHAYQHTRPRTPGGLIEGIADWVRLRAGRAPPHWSSRRPASPGGAWDAGYERTAWFLEWLEGKVGTGLVRRVNEALRVREEEEEGEGAPYEEGVFWRSLTGREVGEWWAEYQEELAKGGEGEEEEEEARPARPTHAV